MKLNIKAFSLTCAIIWAVLIILIAVIYKLTGSYARLFLDLLISIYPWTSLSCKGLTLLAIWGFVDGLICGLVFSWLYNLMAK